MEKSFILATALPISSFCEFLKYSVAPKLLPLFKIFAECLASYAAAYDIKLCGNFPVCRDINCQTSIVDAECFY